MKWLSKALCAVCCCLALTALLSVDAAAAEVPYTVTVSDGSGRSIKVNISPCDGIRNFRSRRIHRQQRSQRQTAAYGAKRLAQPLHPSQPLHVISGVS